MVYSFYFLLVGSRRNECNSLWGWIRGRGQKSTACSENISVMEFYLSAPTLYLRCSLHYADFFQVSLMIRWYCKLSLYMINLSLYCRNISFYQCMSYVTWCTSRSKITLKVTALFFVKWQARSLCCLLKKTPNLLDDTSSE